MTSFVIPLLSGKHAAAHVAASLGWERYVGMKGRIIAMTTFGASAPLKDLQKKFGFTVEAVVQKTRELIGK